MSTIIISEQLNPRISIIDTEHELGYHVQFKYKGNLKSVGKKQPYILILPTDRRAVKAAEAWVFEGKSFEEIKHKFKGKENTDQVASNAL